MRDSVAASRIWTTSCRVLEVGDRLLAAVDAIEEVPELRLQRLDVRQPWHVHVARSLDQAELAEALELAERAAEVLAVDAGVVDRHLIGDVVVDDHLAAADDGHPPHLFRAEPGELDVRDGEVVLEHDEGKVGYARLQVVVGVAVDRDRLDAEPVLDDRNVVRAEVPDRVDVGAHAAEVEPLRVDVVDLAQLAAAHQLVHVLDCRAEAEGVADHQREAALPRIGAERAAVAGRESERLFDQDVLSSLERFARELDVCRRVGGDDDGVDRLVLERLCERGRRPGGR